MTQNGVACNKLRIRSVVRNFQLCALLLLLLLLLFLLLLPLLHRHPFGGFATLHWNAPGGHRTGLLACAANECASMRMTMATSIGLGLGFSVFRLVFAMCHEGWEVALFAALVAHFVDFCVATGSRLLSLACLPAARCLPMPCQAFHCYSNARFQFHSKRHRLRQIAGWPERESERASGRETTDGCMC